MWQNWRLVNGHELYNVNIDPSQNNDLSTEHPDIVSQLHDHYQAWWDGVGQNLNHYHPLTIGTANENPMRLCSCDWAWVYADNQSNIRGCVTCSFFAASSVNPEHSEKSPDISERRAGLEKHRR